MLFPKQFTAFYFGIIACVCSEITLFICCDFPAILSEHDNALQPPSMSLSVILSHHYFIDNLE